MGTGGTFGGPYHSNFYEFTDPFLTSVADESQSTESSFYYIGNNSFIFKSYLKCNNCNFELYDINGRLISSDPTIDSNNIFRITENIKTGIYTYVIYQNRVIILQGKVFVN